MKYLTDILGINLFGIVEIPNAVFWAVVCVVVLLALGFIAWGFIKEIRKK